MKGNAGGEALNLTLGDDSAAGQRTQTAITLTTSWQQFTIGFIGGSTSAGPNPLTLSITTQSAAAVTFFVDDVIVAPGAVPPTYFDGDSGTGATWQGTAGASPSVQPAGVSLPTSTAQAAATNMCPNPNFEHDTPGGAAAGWATSSTLVTTGAAATVTTSSPQAGSNALQVVTTSGSAHEGVDVAATTNSMANGFTYWVSVWLKGNAGGEALTIMIGDGGSGQVTQKNVTLSKAWTQYWVEVTATANRASLHVAVRTQAATAVTFFIDTVGIFQVVTVKTPPPSYFDGDTSGDSWAGTVGNSASNQPATTVKTQLPGALTHDAGGSALFTGTATGYVLVPDAAALRITGDLTIEGWIKPTGVTGTQVLVSKLSGSNGYELGLNGTHLYFTAGGTTVTDTAVISAGSWQYVAVTLTGTTVQFYVNGAPTNSGTGAVPTSSSAALTLGANPTPANYYTGQAQEFAVASHAATPGDISGQYALA